MLGFNHNEIKVFLAILARDCSTPTKVSGASRLPRTTINHILLKLERRGFLERVKVKGHWEWKTVRLTDLKENILKTARIFEEK